MASVRRHFGFNSGLKHLICHESILPLRLRRWSLLLDDLRVVKQVEVGPLAAVTTADRLRCGVLAHGLRIADVERAAALLVLARHDTLLIILGLHGRIQTQSSRSQCSRR